MAYTTAQLEALETAVASGVLTVRVGDQSTTYHSMDEMRKLIREMRSDLGIVPPVKRAGIFNPSTGRGL